MALLVLLLALVLMFATAYTLAVEQTLHALGLMKREDGSAGKFFDARVRISLGIYLTWLNPTFLLAMSLYLIAARASAWYYGVTLVALCTIGGLLIGWTTRLHSGSPEIVATLVAQLKHRQQMYRNANDATRLQAVDELLARIQSRPNLPA